MKPIVAVRVPGSNLVMTFADMDELARIRDAFNGISPAPAHAHSLMSTAAVELAGCGTDACYKRGCRCADCGAAHSAAGRMYADRAKARNRRTR